MQDSFLSGVGREWQLRPLWPLQGRITDKVMAPKDTTYTTTNMLTLAIPKNKIVIEMFNYTTLFAHSGSWQNDPPRHSMPRGRNPIPAHSAMGTRSERSGWVGNSTLGRFDAWSKPT
eukprot:165844-Amphidinium_carterae.1